MSKSFFSHVARPDLVTMVRQRILEGIGRGAGGRLPPERLLSTELGVSRPTLRRALQELQAKGVLVRRGERGERFVSRVRHRKTAASKVVRVLQNGDPACVHGEHLATTGYLADRLHKNGNRLSVENNPACFARKPSEALERLLSSAAADVWILHRSTEAMQIWFSTRGIPCLVLGSAWEGTGLPSIDVDHAASCRHAAGMLIARGHRRLAILRPASAPRGDRTGLEAFASAAAAHTNERITVRDFAHDGTAPGILDIMARMFRLSEVADGWLVFGAHFFATVLTRLTATGIKPGADLSLVSRDYEPFFDFLVPSPACYRRNLAHLHRGLGRMVAQLLDHETIGEKKLFVECDFQDGDTLHRPG